MVISDILKQVKDIKKKINKRFVINTSIFFSLSSLYIFTRLYSIKAIPLFIDEIIYARWAQIGKYDGLYLVSLTDGKQPLFIWLTTLMMQIIHNPIYAARFVSILCGILTTVGLLLLSRELFRNKTVALLTAFLYIIFPFALLINQLGIYESLVGMLLVWSLYTGILLVKNIRLDISLLLGMLFGLSLLTKTSGMQAIYLYPLSLLVSKFTTDNWVKNKKMILWMLFSLIAIGLGFLYSKILLLSPLHYMIDEKNYKFIYHFHELIPYNAFSSWGPNFMKMLTWTSSFFSIPVLLIAFFSLFKTSFRKEKILLFLWFLIPVVYLSLFSRSLSVRYLYPMTLTLLPLAALGLYYLCTLQKTKRFFIYIFLLSISFVLYTDYKILTDLKRAPLPKEFLYEHVNGWASGEGIREIVKYLMTISQNGPIFIATEGTYGSLPTTAMELYFINNPSVERMGLEIIPASIPNQLMEKAKTKPVYIIFNRRQDIPKWPMDLIFEKRKGISNYYIRLYKVRS